MSSDAPQSYHIVIKLKSESVTASNAGIPYRSLRKFLRAQRWIARINNQKIQCLIKSFLNFGRQAVIIFFERLREKNFHYQLLLFFFNATRRDLWSEKGPFTFPVLIAMLASSSFFCHSGVQNKELEASIAIKTGKVKG